MHTPQHLISSSDTGEVMSSYEAAGGNRPSVSAAPSLPGRKTGKSSLCCLETHVWHD